MSSPMSERIRKILSEQNLKQSELGLALGVSANYISLLATGKKNNVSLTLAKLVEALYGYPAQWVMTGEDQKALREEALRHMAEEKLQRMDEDALQKLKVYLEGNG